MPQAQINENKAENARQSLYLIMAMAAILSLIGGSMWGLYGIVAAIVLTGVGVFFGRRISPRVVLAMYKAKPILNSNSPRLYSIFDQLCERAELDPKPGLFYIPSKVPNAFAVGHDQTAAVALTDGLLRIMNEREIQGIMAHEISHLSHRDTHVMGIADTMSRLTVFLSRVGLLMMLFSLATIFYDGDPLWYLLRGTLLFFAPTISVLLQLALSRSREFNADMGAIELTGDPYGLASALEKLDRLSDHQSFWKKILYPNYREPQPALLRTHPDTDLRIEKLLKLAQAQQRAVPHGQQPYVRPVRVMNQHPRRVEIGFQPRIRRRPKYHIMSGIFH